MVSCCVEMSEGKMREPSLKSNPDVRFESCSECEWQVASGKWEVEDWHIFHCNAGEGGCEW